MSLINRIKDSNLGLKGADIPKRDGKVDSKINLQSPLSLKGKKPAVTYEDEIKAMDVDATRGVDLTIDTEQANNTFVI